MWFFLAEWNNYSLFLPHRIIPMGPELCIQLVF